MSLLMSANLVVSAAATDYTTDNGSRSGISTYGTTPEKTQDDEDDGTTSGDSNSTVKEDAGKDVVVNVDVVNRMTKLIYGVSIEWEEPTFTFAYKDTVNLRWDPEQHGYVDKNGIMVPISGELDKDSVKVRVYNHSNGTINTACYVGADSMATGSQYKVPDYDINLSVTNADGLNAELPAPAENSALDSVLTEYVLGISGTDLAQLAVDLALNGKTEAKLGTVVVNIGRGINPISVYPYQDGELIYNGETQYPTWVNYDPSNLEISNETSGVNAGTYTATFTPKEGYCWPDGSTGPKDFPWTIGKATIGKLFTVDTVAMGMGTTSSKAPIKPSLSRLVTELIDAITVSSTDDAIASGTLDTSGTQAIVAVSKNGLGNCTITMNIAETENYYAASDSVDVICVDTLVLPTPNELTYNGNVQSASWIGYDSAKMTIGGVTEGTDAGTYTANFTPKAGYTWPDGSTEAKDVTWTINRAVIPKVPSQSNTLTYSKTTQQPTWNDYNTVELTAGGTLSGLTAGSYPATFTPTKNYMWSDGTITSKTAYWKINKAPQTLGIKEVSTIDYEETTDSFQIECEGNGKVTAVSSDPSIASVSVSGKTITITKRGNGTTSIRISVAEDNNYLASDTKVCTVTCRCIPVLAAFSSWYKGSIPKTSVTAVHLLDSGKPTGTITERWDASASRDGSVTGYLVGTEVYVIGNGYGKIYANPYSVNAFAFGTRDMNESVNGADSTALRILDGLSILDTSNVVNMAAMFYGDTLLTELDVSGFNTSNVQNMSAMFYCCNGLTTLDVSGFDTSNVSNMSSMFNRCENVQALDVSNFNTSNATDMNAMFMYCTKLTTVDVSNFDTSNVEDLSSLFLDAYSLKTVDVSSFDTSSNTDFNEMFMGCHNLTSIDVSGWKTGLVTDMAAMFYECNVLTDIKGLANWDTSSSTTMQLMFRECYKLVNADVSNFKTGNVTDMGNMFYDCESIPSLDVSGWDTGKVTDMTALFWNCVKVPVLDVSNWDVSSVTTMWNLFDECKSITSLDLSRWNTSSLENMNLMFENCTGLTSLDLSSFDTSKVTTMKAVFSGCTELVSINLSGFNTANVTDMNGMFADCQKLASLNVSHFNTANVTDMGHMFTNCHLITSFDLSKWNTANVTVMEQMFAGCWAVEEIYASNLWSVAKVTSSADMFIYCPKLSGAIAYNESKVTAAYANYSNGYLTYKAA